MKSKAKDDAAHDMLFEIGTEELPATSLADIFTAGENIFELKFKKLLESHRLSARATKVFMTPRRLVFWAEAVSDKQAAKDTLTKLMAKQEAYDNSGKPTEKFTTILGHRKVSLAEIVIDDFNGKEFVFIKKSESRLKTSQVLPELCSELVRSLTFSKTMKWDDSGIVFSRPIRHYLCFYGNTAVKFKIGGTPTFSKTVIFSKAKRLSLAVKSPADYFKILKNKGVILDAAERRTEIRAQLASLSKSFGAKLYEDPFLLNEVVFLAEMPYALSAPFNEDFLKLPLEVLTVSMARKQRIFGLTDSQGKVMPHFLAVLDGKATAAQAKKIASNIENILHAKLKDSLFFFQEDTKISLEKKREELKNLVFLKGAGSMFEKSERLVKLSIFLAGKLSLADDSVRTLEHAAYLCKSDLLTQMVGEFPELQGIIGKYYALKNGEDERAAAALGEQYLPRTASDPLPQTLEGSLLSVLDKVDLVVACFGVGLEPSSSADPYGLRRSAYAVIRILLEKNITFSLRELLSQAKQALSVYVQKDREAALLMRLEELFKDRFRAFMLEAGHRPDIVDAVLVSQPFDDLTALRTKIESLGKIQSQAYFSKACKVVERTVNILKGVKEPFTGQADPALLTEEAEKKVFAGYEASKKGISRAIAARKIADATSLYAEAFFDILNEFFEKVFVNAEDPNVRKNRILLLKNIKELYTNEVADLSKIKV